MRYPEAGRAGSSNVCSRKHCLCTLARGSSSAATPRSSRITHGPVHTCCKICGKPRSRRCAAWCSNAGTRCFVVALPQRLAVRSLFRVVKRYSYCPNARTRQANAPVQRVGRICEWVELKAGWGPSSSNRGVSLILSSPQGCITWGF